MLAACTAEQRPPGERVTLDELADVSEALPDGVIGIEVGPLAPSEPVTFCHAIALVPVRWITDAVVPLQIWIDTFDEVADTPAPAESALILLHGYATTRMAWQLGTVDDRPPWGDAEIAASMSLADAAITNCPELPLVLGLPGISDTPVAWQDTDPTEIAERCADMLIRMEEGVEGFVALFDRQPRHQMEMEISLPGFFASDFHGVLLDTTGKAFVVSVPGGACDLG